MRAARPWERARGSRVLAVLKPAPPPPPPSGAEYDDEPDFAEPPERPARAPGSRPGDRLRRIADYSHAASEGAERRPPQNSGRRDATRATTAARNGGTDWTLSELLEALTDEFDDS